MAAASGQFGSGTGSAQDGCRVSDQAGRTASDTGSHGEGNKEQAVAPAPLPALLAAAGAGGASGPSSSIKVSCDAQVQFLVARLMISDNVKVKDKMDQPQESFSKAELRKLLNHIRYASVDEGEWGPFWSASTSPLRILVKADDFPPDPKLAIFWFRVHVRGLANCEQESTLRFVVQCKAREEPDPNPFFQLARPSASEVVRKRVQANVRRVDISFTWQVIAGTAEVGSSVYTCPANIVLARDVVACIVFSLLGVFRIGYSRSSQPRTIPPLSGHPCMDAVRSVVDFPLKTRYTNCFEFFLTKHFPTIQHMLVAAIEEVVQVHLCKVGAFPPFPWFSTSTVGKEKHIAWNTTAVYFWMGELRNVKKALQAERKRLLRTEGETTFEIDQSIEFLEEHVQTSNFFIFVARIRECLFCSNMMGLKDSLCDSPAGVVTVAPCSWHEMIDLFCDQHQLRRVSSITHSQGSFSSLSGGIRTCFQAIRDAWKTACAEEAEPGTTETEVAVSLPEQVDSSSKGKVETQHVAVSQYMLNACCSLESYLQFKPAAVALRLFSYVTESGHSQHILDGCGVWQPDTREHLPKKTTDSESIPLGVKAEMRRVMSRAVSDSLKSSKISNVAEESGSLDLTARLLGTEKSSIEYVQTMCERVLDSLHTNINHRVSTATSQSDVHTSVASELFSMALGRGSLLPEAKQWFKHCFIPASFSELSSLASFVYGLRNSFSHGNPLRTVLPNRGTGSDLEPDEVGGGALGMFWSKDSSTKISDLKSTDFHEMLQWVAQMRSMRTILRRGKKVERFLPISPVLMQRWDLESHFPSLRKRGSSEDLGSQGHASGMGTRRDCTETIMLQILTQAARRCSLFVDPSAEQPKTGLMFKHANFLCAQAWIIGAIVEWTTHLMVLELAGLRLSPYRGPRVHVKPISVGAERRKWAKHCLCFFTFHSVALSVGLGVPEPNATCGVFSEVKARVYIPQKETFSRLKVTLLPDGVALPDSTEVVAFSENCLKPATQKKWSVPILAKRVELDGEHMTHLFALTHVRYGATGGALSMPDPEMVAMVIDLSRSRRNAEKPQEVDSKVKSVHKSVTDPCGVGTTRGFLR